MKPKNFTKKLLLKKSTVTSLNSNELDDIQGGTTIYTCAGSFHTECVCRSCIDIYACWIPNPVTVD